MHSELTYGELQDEARLQRIDAQQPFDELRKALDIKECKWCSGEYVRPYSEGFCSDLCEVEYINEYFPENR